MAGLFAKTKAKNAETSTVGSKKKSTVWLVGLAEESKLVAESVHELNKLQKESKSVEAKMAIHKQVVKKHAERNYINDYAANGISPDTPMTVQNQDGEKCTYVVQDRSGQYAIKPDQCDALRELLGADATENLLYEETAYSFNRDVMAIPGVMEVVEKALESAVKKLTDTKDGKSILTPDQAELLLGAESKQALRPGTLDRLSLICGRDSTRITQFLEIIGSNVTRYVKV